VYFLLNFSAFAEKLWQPARSMASEPMDQFWAGHMPASIQLSRLSSFSSTMSPFKKQFSFSIFFCALLFSLFDVSGIPCSISDTFTVEHEGE